MHACFSERRRLHSVIQEQANLQLTHRDTFGGAEKQVLLTRYGSLLQNRIIFGRKVIDQISVHAVLKTSTVSERFIEQGITQ